VALPPLGFNADRIDGMSGCLLASVYGVRLVANLPGPMHSAQMPRLAGTDALMAALDLCMDARRCFTITAPVSR
jgi:hypothetical protein